MILFVIFLVFFFIFLIFKLNFEINKDQKEEEEEAKLLLYRNKYDISFLIILMFDNLRLQIFLN
jgi:hypothetical protein